MKSTYEFATVMTLLRDNGIMYVGCYYSGGGDDGAIDNLAFYDITKEEDFNNNEPNLDYGDQGNIEIDETVITTGICSYIETLFYDNCLNKIEDWYNNEGGYGTMLMCTKTGNFINENNCYRQEIDTYMNEGQIQVD